jgi:DHA1 family bicyclomycin/chloramphenicol resistance-like MFS transporter
MHSTLFRTALVLGLLSAIGPFSIDMYLPALPDIAEDLRTPESSVKLTMTLYFLAFGVSQFVWGPMADAYGRKLPLILGISIFAVATVACALAPSIEWLIVARFVQGIGGAAVGVVPRAIIRDRFTGVEATRLMAMVMLVISISPMLAPLAGSLILAVGGLGWRAIFVALLLIAALSLTITVRALPETLALRDRVPVNLPNIAGACRRLLGSPLFMGLTMVGAFGFGSFFVFINTASFVYQGEAFGLSNLQFALAFAVNALGFFAASQAAAPLGARFGLVAVMRVALWGFAASAVTLLLLTLAGLGTLPVIVAFLFAGNAFLGLVMPPTFILALEEHGDIAGTASSLGGTLQMVTAALIGLATAGFASTTALPMVATIAACAVLALGIGLLTLRRLAPSPAPAE